jgi:hypothetical protein
MSSDALLQENTRLRNKLCEREETIHHLEIVNDQLSLYPILYRQKNQEEKWLHVELKCQIERAEQAEKELENIKQKIRDLNPMTQWLTQQYKQLVHTEQLLVVDDEGYRDEDWVNLKEPWELGESLSRLNDLSRIHDHNEPLLSRNPSESEGTASSP